MSCLKVELFGRVLISRFIAMAIRFEFPNPVNETSARLVATGVVTLGVLFLILQSGWILVALAYGFLARVLFGPRFSPLARVATQVITPRLNFQHRFSPGQPKRFAQAIGLVFSATAGIAWLSGASTFANITIVLLIGAASLEAFVGFCVGCAIFKVLMRIGLIPESVCFECADISRRIKEGAIKAS